MSSPFTVAVLVLAAALAGAVFAMIVARKDAKDEPLDQSEEVGTLKGLLSGREQQIQERDQRIGTLELEKSALTAQLTNSLAENASLKEGLTAKASALETATQAMNAEFARAASAALEGSGKTFLQLAEAKLSGQQRTANGELTTKKAEIDGLIAPMKAALATLDERVRSLKQSEEGLLQETQQLSRALRESKYRGNWGELQLRRIAELAGMLERCDFHLQDTVLTDENRRLYPDMTARLPNHRVVVVDSKVTLDAYRDAANATDPEIYRQKLSDHAKAIRKRILDLGSKEYRSHVDGSADFVVYFIPGESFFSAALAADSELIEFAAQRNIVLASPTTLLSLLRAVALGWKEARLADDAKEICEVGRELYNRLRKSTEYIDTVGSSLESAIDAYDSFIGSMEHRIFPQARRFGTLVGSDNEMPEVHPVDRRVRKRAASDWSLEQLSIPAIAANAEEGS